MGLVFFFGKLLQCFHVEKDCKDDDGDAKVNSIFEQFDNHGMIDNRKSIIGKEVSHQIITPRKSLAVELATPRKSEYTTAPLTNNTAARRRQTDII